MKIVVSDQVHLSEFRSSDKEALVLHLNDRDIYDRTLRIPFPYTEAAADEWLALYAKTTEKHGQPAHFAIRTGAPLEVIENLQELDDDEELYESIEDIWPEYPTKEDFLFNEDEY